MIALYLNTLNLCYSHPRERFLILQRECDEVGCTLAAMQRLFEQKGFVVTPAWVYEGFYVSYCP